MPCHYAVFIAMGITWDLFVLGQEVEGNDISQELRFAGTLGLSPVTFGATDCDAISASSTHC